MNHRTVFLALTALSLASACGGLVEGGSRDGASLQKGDRDDGTTVTERVGEDEDGTSDGTNDETDNGTGGTSAPECGVTGWNTGNDPGLVVSADGLEVMRERGGSFEGDVRASTAHLRGRWYFEVTVLGDGNDNIAAIGLAGEQGGAAAECHVDLTNSVFCNFRDDDGSSSGGGGRTGTQTARPGDVIGVLADLEEQTLRFTLNGESFASSSSLSYAQRLPMQPSATLAMGHGFRAAFATFQYAPPEGFLPWECTP